MSTETFARVAHYHDITKHSFDAYAPGPGYMDWATQPEPFRRYKGAQVIDLDLEPPGDLPGYEDGFEFGRIPPAPLDRKSISRLLLDSLAISAWKEFGESRWALRVNPSSGNLHPTEGYLVSGAVPALNDRPMVCHYAPREHIFERRAEFSPELWREMTSELPEQSVLVGLTSICWRESWKYGERAYRYSHHDLGHAIATVSIAAAGLGWRVSMLDGLSTEELAVMLGVTDPHDAEPEHPECLLAISPHDEPCVARRLPKLALQAFAGLDWAGRPNTLSPGQRFWPQIHDVTVATNKPAQSIDYPAPIAVPPRTARADSDLSLRRIIHQRRSAVDMDGITSMSREAFYGIMISVLFRPARVPFVSLCWPPLVHLGLFVHRVRDLEPGLYFLVRNPDHLSRLRKAMSADFDWLSPPDCPAGLPLYQLQRGDMRSTSKSVSCGQDIAGDGCFSLGMITEFERPLREYGAWFYPCLFWETGLVGQVLYLEAEAAGIRSTGMGCYFDEPMHDILGLQSHAFQSLYHFTVGGPINDPRLTSLPAYPGMRGSEKR